jgi:hypothetical protein
VFWSCRECNLVFWWKEILPRRMKTVCVAPESDVFVHCACVCGVAMVGGCR